MIRLRPSVRRTLVAASVPVVRALNPWTRTKPAARFSVPVTVAAGFGTVRLMLLRSYFNFCSLLSTGGAGGAPEDAPPAHAGVAYATSVDQAARMVATAYRVGAGIWVPGWDVAGGGPGVVSH